MKKKIFIQNLGCSKNLVDAESILGDFQSSGHEIVESSEQADLIFINTCGFIESAKEESIQEILASVESKTDKQEVIVTGCLSQRYKEDLQKEIPEVKHFFGTYKPKEIIQELGMESPVDLCPTPTGRVKLEGYTHHRYVKIAEGCNRVCSFCAIPGMRGRQQSRPVPSIIQEVNDLVAMGVVEISLVAQDLTYYGREKDGPEATLEFLLKELLEKTQIQWIRLMYAYPAFLQDDLLTLIQNEPRICSYIDMPIQHISDSVLKNMRRGHSQKSLEKILWKIKNEYPAIALRTTLLVGFPGETEEDFEQLLQFVESYKFDRLGVFTYSDEDGTHAATLSFPVPDTEVAESRMEKIMSIQQEISMERNQNFIGKKILVMIDEVAEGSDYRYLCRTQFDAPEVDNIVYLIDGDLEPGDIVEVQIVDAAPYDLFAKVTETGKEQ